MFFFWQKAQTHLWNSLVSLSPKKLKEALDHGANPNELNEQGQLFVLELLKSAARCSYWLERCDEMLNLLIDHPQMDWQKKDSQGFGVVSALSVYIPSGVLFDIPKAWRTFRDIPISCPEDATDIITSVATLDTGMRLGIGTRFSESLLHSWKADSKEQEGKLLFNYSAFINLVQSEITLDWTQPMLQKNRSSYCTYSSDASVARAFLLAKWDKWDELFSLPLSGLETEHPVEKYTLLNWAVRSPSLTAIDELLKRGADPQSAPPKWTWPKAYQHEIQAVFDKHQLASIIPEAHSCVRKNKRL